MWAVLTARPSQRSASAIEADKYRLHRGHVDHPRPSFIRCSLGTTSIARISERGQRVYDHVDGAVSMRERVPVLLASFMLARCGVWCECRAGGGRCCCI